MTRAPNHVTLASVVSISGGGTPSKARPDYYTGNIPWVTPKDMKSWYLDDSIDHITEQAVSDSTASVVDPGAVIICIRSGVLAHTLPIALNRVAVTLNQDLKALRCSNALHAPFLARFLEWHAPVLLQTVRGTTAHNLSMDVVRQTNIPLPPLHIQKRIAGILDAADGLRAKRRESIEQLDSLIQATFLEMFGDPVTNPQGWAVRELAELVDVDADMVDPTNAQYRGLLHYGPDRITKNTGELLPAQSAAEDGLTSSKFLCKPGHVLYSKIRPYLNKVAIVTERCLCSADVYPVAPREATITKEFLWVVLRSKSFLAFIESCAGRANIPKINRKEFLAYRCMCPPLDLQTRFASIVESIEQQKARLKAHLAELDTLFASLQSRAFNGELVA